MSSAVLFGTASRIQSGTDAGFSTSVPGVARSAALALPLLTHSAKLETLRTNNFPHEPDAHAYSFRGEDQRR